MLSLKLSCSREFITSFGVVGDDMCGLVGVIVGALSRFVGVPLLPEVVNSVTVCL